MLKTSVVRFPLVALVSSMTVTAHATPLQLSTDPSFGAVAKATPPSVRSSSAFDSSHATPEANPSGVRLAQSDTPSPSRAEAGGEAASADGAASTSAMPTLKEVTVTAERRAQNLQRVPIAINVVGADVLKQAGVGDIRALEQVIPGMSVDSKASAAHFFLRGIGIATNSPGLDPPVATYVDDVYIPSATAATLALDDIDRIEVLKGPQGTLYGRNASAGVISVHTLEPGSTAQFKADAAYSSFDTSTLRAYVSTPLSSEVAANLAAYYNNQSEGWGINGPTGQDVHKGRDLELRGKIRGKYENLLVLLSGWYGNQRNSYGAQTVLPGTFARGGIAHSGGYWDTNVDAPQHFGSSNFGVSTKAAYDLGFARVIDIVAYQRVDPLYFIDADETPVPQAAQSFGWREGTTTNELQLISNSGGKVDWVTGLFYLYDDIGPYALITSGSLTPAGNTLTSYLTTSSLAPFGQATVHVTNSTEVTLGARYTRDRRHITGTIRNNLGTDLTPPADQAATFDKFTYRLAIQQELTDRISAYASASRGFKAGILQTAAPSAPPTNPEIVDAYEVGVKTELFDRRLRWNTAAFDYAYKDMQLRAFLPNATVPTYAVVNAANTRIRGVDIDFDALPFQGLTLTGGVEYLDARYSDFPDAPFFVANAPAIGGNTQIVQSARGNYLPHAPKVSLNVSANYEFRLGADTLEVGGNYAYKSRIYFDPDNRVSQASFGIVSLTANLNLPTGIGFGIWVNNLTNEKYISDEVETSQFTVFTPGAPRTMGVRISYSY